MLTQIVGDTFNISFPKANVTLDFNYLFKLGNKSDVRTGNATLNGTGIGINMTVKTFVNETDPGTGQLLITPLITTWDYHTLWTNFTDPWSQLEWDAAMENPEAVKFVSTGILNYVVQGLFEKTDLRKAILFSTKKGLNIDIGFTDPFKFVNTTSTTQIDKEALEIKMHAVFTLPKGDQVSGLFNVDMDAPMQSYDYTSFALNSDIFNKIIKATSQNEEVISTFNQKFLDKINFTLLKLDTTSMKAFIPRLEPDFGVSKGVFIRLKAPIYDDQNIHAINSAG